LSRSGSENQKNNGLKFKRNSTKTKKQNKFWIVFITIFSFIISAILMFISQRIFEGVSFLGAIIVLVVIILISIAFDIFGIAVATADEKPFHSMASRKYYGAKRAIMLIRNADRVASFSHDVVGDVCGIISGAISAFIVLRVSSAVPLIDVAVLGILLSGFVASLTIGGKAVGKGFAIRNSTYIVYKISVVIGFFTRKRT
jgi:hypothetical protein